MAMCELRRRNYEKRCIRFLWSDSSMQLGHDILWAQIHEIPVDSLVPVFKAFVDLTLHTHAFVRSRSETTQRAGAQDVQPGRQSTEELPMQDVWRPFLRKLLLIKSISTPQVSWPPVIEASLIRWRLFCIPSVIIWSLGCTTDRLFYFVCLCVGEPWWQIV